MKKQILMGMTSATALFLAACGSDIKGNELYADGEYTSYVSAYQYFAEQNSKDGGNTEAEEQMRIISKEFIKLSKKLIEENYSNENALYAKQYLDYAIEMVPDDEELLEVKDMIEENAEKQLLLNQFSNYLEGVYSEYNEIFSGFNDLKTKMNIGQAQPIDIKNYISQNYSAIVEIRKEVSDATYSESISQDETLAEINDKIFRYLVGVEKELSMFITSKEEMNVDYINKAFSRYEVSEMNSVFSDVLASFNKILNEKNEEGERTYIVKNELNYIENKKAPEKMDEVEDVLNLKNNGQKIKQNDDKGDKADKAEESESNDSN